MIGSQEIKRSAHYVPIEEALVTRRRGKFLGITADEYIRYFFRGNATLAMVILALITFFLFKEAIGLEFIGIKSDSGFFAQNHENLTLYRQAGLEYVDFLRQQVDDVNTLGRYISQLRLKQFQQMTAAGVSPEAANEKLAAFDDFQGKFRKLVEGHEAMLGEWTEAASAIKDRHKISQDQRVQHQMLLDTGKPGEAAAMAIEVVDFTKEVKIFTGQFGLYQELNRTLAAGLTSLSSEIPSAVGGGFEEGIQKIRGWMLNAVESIGSTENSMRTWDANRPVTWSQNFNSYLFGREWLTASFWQDWYGVVPLFVGSLCISFVALAFAVPFGVGAAIYVNQIATAREQAVIKPTIEFVSAIPSVVLGFFGIAVFGEFVRWLSATPAFAWVPFFPMAERLNIFTAGMLLGFMAIPTIFSLAEDALNNVPKAFVEASLALGSTKLQTIVRIMVPASLSGIIAAVLLGFGRVIGETMVVLLCAGNRIKIPDFSTGLGAFFQPVHTMTGIIAQEMGEVVKGEIHYRALFMVGITLFFVSLLINYLAQIIVRRYKISNG